MTTLSHPFMRNSKPEDLPPDQSKLVDEIFDWIQQQPKFPNFTKIHAHQFLHACLWDMNNAKKALKKYCQIRTASPDLFGNRDPLTAQMQNVLNIAQMTAMPHKTPEGYNILIYRLIDSDPSKLHFAEAVKGFCMFNDYRISEDGLCEGYVVVFDMKGVKLGHLTRVQLGALRTFMVYIQEAHPVRLKKIYIVHTAAFINQVMALIKPLIKSEMFALLKFTSHGPTELLPKELLPKDYGGSLDTIESFYAPERKLLETEYRDWLMDSAGLRDKGSVILDTGSNKQDESLNHSFSSLEID